MLNRNLRYNRSSKLTCTVHTWGLTVSYNKKYRAFSTQDIPDFGKHRHRSGGITMVLLLLVDGCCGCFMSFVTEWLVANQYHISNQ